MSSIAVIDYDAGNTMSVMNALKSLGYDVVLTKDPGELLNAGHIVFPGVGAYADAVQKLKLYNLTDVIKEVVAKGTPFLGICLGMQLLFDYSTENAADLGVESIGGLGILKGKVTGFNENGDFIKCKTEKEFSDLKIPHMGWNSLDICKKDSRFFRSIPDGSFVYFVHSFFVSAENRSDVAAQTEYGIGFDVAVEKDNVFGCQFHPEKSGDVGMAILKNFCTI